METFFQTSLALLQVILFATALSTGLSRRKEQLVSIYALQSLIVAFILIILEWREHSFVLFAIVATTVIIKCILTPFILLRLIKKHQLIFTAPGYLNTPTVLGLMLLLVFAVHRTLAPLFAHIAPGETLLYLSISAFFASLFSAVNRKGAFSQIIGVLSAENCLVSVAALMNIHTELWLELGILGDIFTWMLIVSTFVSIVSRHFGTTDISEMKELAE